MPCMLHALHIDENLKYIHKGNIKVTAVLENGMFAYQYVVCHACYTCTNMHPTMMLILVICTCKCNLLKEF